MLPRFHVDVPLVLSVHGLVTILTPKEGQRRAFEEVKKLLEDSVAERERLGDDIQALHSSLQIATHDSQVTQTLNPKP